MEILTMQLCMRLSVPLQPRIVLPSSAYPLLNTRMSNVRWIREVYKPAFYRISILMIMFFIISAWNSCSVHEYGRGGPKACFICQVSCSDKIYANFHFQLFFLTLRCQRCWFALRPCYIPTNVSRICAHRKQEYFHCSSDRNIARIRKL
jgi:hypothetical protein